MPRVTEERLYKGNIQGDLVMAYCPECDEEIDYLSFTRFSSGTYDGSNFDFFEENPEIEFYCPKCKAHVACTEDEAKIILENDNEESL